MPIPEITALTPESTLAYIAGIIDGEGSITIRKNRCSYAPLVTVGNSSEKLLKWLQSSTGMGGVHQWSRNLWDIRKTGANWDVIRLSDIYDLLTAVQPYLIVKADQCYIMLLYAEHRLSVPHKAAYSEEDLALIGFLRESNTNGRGR